VRILTVADFFYPHMVGGSAIYAAQVMRELVVRGHEITVLTRDPGEGSRISEWEGMAIRYYAFASSPFQYPLAVLRTQAQIGQWLEREPFDLVNAHHASSGLAVARMLRTRQTPPLVFFFHGPWHLEAMAKERVDGLAGNRSGTSWRPQFHLRKMADRFILRHSDHIVVLSDYMAGEADAICPVALTKSTKIPSGVDLERFKPCDDGLQTRRRLGLPEDQRLLLSVRRLSPRMGLENLIEAMCLVECQRQDVTMLIGGKGPLFAELQRRIDELELQRTRLLGYIDDRDLASYYQVSDLFVMPSVTLEGFGLSTLEALASGVPVLGTPTGGTPEVLGGVLPDFILEGTSPEQIARGILAKLETACRPEIKNKVRTYAEDFAWSHIGDVAANFFADLSGKKAVV